MYSKIFILSWIEWSQNSLFSKIVPHYFIIIFSIEPIVDFNNKFDEKSFDISLLFFMFSFFIVFHCS